MGKKGEVPKQIELQLKEPVETRVPKHHTCYIIDAPRSQYFLPGLSILRSQQLSQLLQCLIQPRTIYLTPLGSQDFLYLI